MWVNLIAEIEKQGDAKTQIKVKRINLISHGPVGELADYINHHFDEITMSINQRNVQLTSKTHNP